MFKYRRRRYGRNRRDNVADWIRHQDKETLDKVKKEDPECFDYFAPIILMENAFSWDQYYEHREFRDTEMADFFFKKCGVDPNTQCTFGGEYGRKSTTGTILWHATQRLCVKQVKYSLSVGCGPSVPAKLEGTTPLQVAAIQASELRSNPHTGRDERLEEKLDEHWLYYQEILDLLIAAGADINEGDGCGRTALMHVCSGRLVVKDHLSDLAKRYDPTKDDERPVQRMREDVGRDLLRRGARADMVSSTGESVLSILAETGMYDLLMMILDTQPQPHAMAKLCNTATITGDYPLHIAAKKRDVPMLHQLLRLGADCHALDASGHTAVSLAVEQVCRIGSRFTRTEDQRLVSVFAHHGMEFKPTLVHEVMKKNSLPLISSIINCGMDFDPASPECHQLLFESALVKNYDHQFELMLLSADWPQDVLCDAWLVRAAISDPPYTHKHHLTSDSERDKVVKCWEMAATYGLATHQFPSRATCPRADPQEERDWLTICDTLCVEERTWEGHAKMLCCLEKAIPDGEHPVIQKLLPLGGTTEDGEPRTKPGDKVLPHVLHRIACFHRIFGFFQPTFLEHFHRVSKSMKVPRDVRLDGEYYLPAGGCSGVDSDVRWLRSPARFSERVIMNRHQMQMALRMRFSVSDEEYLGTALEDFTFDASSFIGIRMFDHPVNLALLVQWYGHVMACVPLDHPLQLRTVEKFSFLIMRLGSYCHSNEKVDQRPNLAQARGWLGFSFDTPIDNKEMLRSSIPDARADMMVMAREAAKIYRRQRPHRTTLFHQLLKEPEQKEYSRYDSPKTLDAEDLVDRMPVIAALLQEGFDLNARDIDGVPALVKALDVHANMIASEKEDGDRGFAVWREIFTIFMLVGNGIHWDAPYSYAQSIKDRIVSQFPDLELVGYRGSQTVPRLICLAAKAIAGLPIESRLVLPPRMVQLVDMHRPPRRPVGLPMWKFVDKCHEYKDDDYFMERKMHGSRYD